MAKDKGKRNNASKATKFVTASSTTTETLNTIITRVSADLATKIPERGYVPSLTAHVPFDSFPLSPYTYNALKTNSYITSTPIQNAVILHALAGRDILAAAKTGSGKTLAFAIPVIETLWREKWSVGDGLGAIILSPTRELALQIFEVLRKVGKNHSMSAGLITGGKKEFREEQMAVVKMNILVATPGRLLQHFEQTPNFDTTGLMFLVLDEADRILDMGFSAQLNSILDYIPTTRQTMLFSATQTKSVRDLARLSLNKPEYISVNEKDEESTPSLLVQNYIMCSLTQKLDVLFSFIKSHLKQKTIIFLSSCAQVKFVNEIFCSLQPGLPLLALHGKIKQKKRTHIYFDFLRRPSAVLFATDIAARGLDFPDVDWVVQLDCPEDAEMYIHRAGRTARNGKKGNSLLILLPSEEKGCVSMLNEAKIPIKRLSVNPEKAVTVSKRAASIVASDPETNRLAKKAFVAYLRSTLLMPNKEVFKIKEVDVKGYAVSLGLSIIPSVRFLKNVGEGEENEKTSGDAGRDDNREKKNKSRKLERLKLLIKEEKLKKKLEKLVKKGGKLPDVEVKGKGGEEEEDEEDQLMVVKTKHEWGEKEPEVDAKNEEKTSVKPDGFDSSAILARRANKKLKVRPDGTSGINRKTTFNDDGEMIDNTAKMVNIEDMEVTNPESLALQNEEFMEKIRERLKATKAQDVADEKARILAKRKRDRRDDGDDDGEKEGGEDDDDGGGVTLASGSEDDKDSDSGSDSGSDSDSDDDDNKDYEAKALEMMSKK